MAQNIAERQAILQNSMSRAKKLMQLDANGTLDKIANGARNGVSESLGGGVTTDQLMTTKRNRSTDALPIQGVMSVAASNVPQAIRESFAKNPIDVNSLYGTQGGTDELSFLNETVQQPNAPRQTQNVRQIVNEGLGTQQTQQYVPSSQIDYPMIRTIVEETVRKYALALNKKIISEGKEKQGGKLTTLTIGESFKFLDDDGNLYECTMKKIGNIKDKKKKSVNG